MIDYAAIDKAITTYGIQFLSIKQGWSDLCQYEGLYNALYDAMFDEMPYGVAKARTGDPIDWIMQTLEDEGYL